jgi:hypothetical protein
MRPRDWGELALLMVLTSFTATNSRGNVIYTYKPSNMNPLYGLPPDTGTTPDYISLSFVRGIHLI